MRSLRDFSDDKLLEMEKAATNTPHGIHARAELERRREERTGDLLKALTREVAILGLSSGRLENLTRWLIGLTWTLIALTILAVG